MSVDSEAARTRARRRNGESGRWTLTCYLLGARTECACADGRRRPSFLRGPRGITETMEMSAAVLPTGPCGARARSSQGPESRALLLLLRLPWCLGFCFVFVFLARPERVKPPPGGTLSPFVLLPALPGPARRVRAVWQAAAARWGRSWRRVPPSPAPVPTRGARLCLRCGEMGAQSASESGLCRRLCWGLVGLGVLSLLVFSCLSVQDLQLLKSALPLIKPCSLQPPCVTPFVCRPGTEPGSGSCEGRT